MPLAAIHSIKINYAKCYLGLLRSDSGHKTTFQNGTKWWIRALLVSPVSLQCEWMRWCLRGDASVHANAAVASMDSRPLIRTFNECTTLVVIWQLCSSSWNMHLYNIMYMTVFYSEQLVHVEIIFGVGHYPCSTAYFKLRGREVISVLWWFCSLIIPHIFHRNR